MHENHRKGDNKINQKTVTGFGCQKKLLALYVDNFCPNVLKVIYEHMYWRLE